MGSNEQNKSSKRGRPKGSKNEFSKKEIESMQNRINELEKSNNSYNDVVDEFVDGFILEMTKNVKTISMDTLQKWFSDPDTYMKEIHDLLTYYYIIDGNISQLYDLIFSLPELNYKIKTFKKMDSYEEDIKKVKICLEKTISHKLLTRSLLVQLAHEGSVLGTWLGDKRNPYFNVFDNLKYVYPYGNYQGKMVGVFDLEYLDGITEKQRETIYNTLKPLVTKTKYNKWKNCTDSNKKEALQLIVLPVETSLVARNRILSFNQRLGLPQGTQAIFDLQHKQKMKDLERAMADKIIRAIAIVHLKSKDDGDNTVKESTQKRVFAKVKKALEKNTNSSSGLTCIGLPSFASFEYPEIKNGDKILDPSKYESINSDITTGTSVSSVLSNGTGGSYSSANLNLDMIYQKIGVMLEQIEIIYNQLITIVLGKSKGQNYMFEYDKQKPLSKTDKLKTLTTLENQGYAISPLLELIGVDANDYINQSIYEIEKLGLRNKISPPSLSYTTSSKDSNKESGRPIEENPTNDNTIQSKENTDNNSNPKPSTE
ncbi:hypothetical protein [Clostridium botulinum]|uniref:hypothetical protein n=1 Tax=Clostridium botulinum TaxID=1491 RepID=UPI001FAFEE2B|nr:hypothetical protein [Clostridium botulinum]